MSMVLSDVAALVGGDLTGNGAVSITGAAIIRDAGEGDITLADSPHLADLLSTCDASAAIVPRGVELEGLPCIRVDDVHAAFARIVAHFRPSYGHRVVGVSPAAFQRSLIRCASFPLPK